ncbi:hypothetical protein BDL97_01G123800 [Sphagnum fallax]|nr:hypothetical protein BDL97_01G123800 [Sphagnum fallax]
MARFGLLAGVATAALGALCSYEARVLHLHSVVPGDTFQFTEVLGCDDACPGSQCSQIQKMSAEERASAGPPILGFRYNGLNSYETLIFAPRY